MGSAGLPGVHRHDDGRRRARRLRRRLRDADEHRPRPLPRLPVAREPHVPAGARRRPRSPCTRPARAHATSPSCSAARRATRSTSSRAATGRAGPRGLPILDGCPSWFAGAILSRHDLGDHEGYLLASDRGAARARRAVVLPGREGHRARPSRVTAARNEPPVTLRRLLPPSRRELTADELAAALDFAASAPRGPAVRRGEHGRAPSTGARASRAARRRSRASPTASSSTRCARAWTPSWSAPARCAPSATGGSCATRTAASSASPPACTPTRSRSSSAAGSTCRATLPLLADAASHVVVITASDASIDGCAARVEYLRSSPVDLAGALARLRAEHGVRSILCEGGPSLNGALLAAGLIDELFLTTVGKLAGGAGALTIIGSAPMDEPARRAPAVAAASATASCSRATPSAADDRGVEARPRRRTIGGMEERDPLDGIGAADGHLGRPVPLPTVALPLARWVEVVASGPGAVQVEWNLDATRPGAPGRLTLYAGLQAPPERGLPQPVGARALRAPRGAAGGGRARASPRPRARVGAGRAAPAAHRPGSVDARAARRASPDSTRA